MRKIISVIGDSHELQKKSNKQLAFETGRLLIDNNYRVMTGGLGGIMKEVLAGAKSSTNYKEGDTIGILPSFDINSANEYVDIPIATGLDVGRNQIIANASAVIIIGGGAGTHVEAALAWGFYKLIIAYGISGGCAELLAGKALDHRTRYKDIVKDVIYNVSTPEEMIITLNSNLTKYVRVHHGIN